MRGAMPAEYPTQADPIGIDAHGVATLLGISESHFFALLRTGRFGPQARRLGRAKRYDREEVLAWFRAGCPARCPLAGDARGWAMTANEMAHRNPRAALPEMRQR